ncbi:hypothetical protein CRG98_030225 [Punica granatum]|uniref:Uncharacterized protein n=1 Tax=Punica granatum TaxID=22663 RepID=A0A2I0IZ67_PUNGR|nr:hypothetical protein CRG98_030225 [Punica granatum]
MVLPDPTHWCFFGVRYSSISSKSYRGCHLASLSPLLLFCYPLLAWGFLLLPSTIIPGPRLRSLDFSEAEIYILILLFILCVRLKFRTVSLLVINPPTMETQSVDAFRLNQLFVISNPDLMWQRLCEIYWDTYSGIFALNSEDVSVSILDEGLI